MLYSFPETKMKTHSNFQVEVSRKFFNKPQTDISMHHYDWIDDKADGKLSGVSLGKALRVFFLNSTISIFLTFQKVFQKNF